MGQSAVLDELGFVRCFSDVSHGSRVRLDSCYSRIADHERLIEGTLRHSP